MNYKILFITNRDVLTSCGALRLIKNRAESLYRDYGVSTDFCVLQRQTRIDSPKREKINAGGQMWITGYSHMSILASYYKFYKNIHNVLLNEEYNAIIISQTALIINISKIRKLTNAPIFLDGHGASEDIYESSRGGSKMILAMRKFAYYIDKCFIRYYLNRIDGCFVVSTGLRKYYEEMTKNQNLKFFRAPCAVVDEITKINYEICRKEYRERFKIKEDEIAFVYSGGIEPWQSVEETIEIFKSIAGKIDQSCKMFIFSYEVELVKEMVANDSRFHVESFKAEELKKALCAMDFSFLIRKNTVTNNVAFPNKFLEYLLARLQVLSTPYVYDVAEQIKLYQVGYIYDFGDDITKLAEYVRNNRGKNLDSKIVSEIINENSFKTRLATFVDYIKRN